MYDTQALAAAVAALPTCEGCHEPLIGQRSDSRYCSGACRQRAYRERRRDEHIERRGLDALDWMLATFPDPGRSRNARSGESRNA